LVTWPLTLLPGSLPHYQKVQPKGCREAKWSYRRPGDSFYRQRGVWDSVICTERMPGQVESLQQLQREKLRMWFKQFRVNHSVCLSFRCTCSYCVPCWDPSENARIGSDCTQSRVSLALNLFFFLFWWTWEFEFRHKSYSVFLLVI
jgi:hypothetical protein